MTLILHVENVPIIASRPHWTAEAYIAAGSYSRDVSGRILLTPDCRTPGEIDTWADHLIGELEEIKARARRIQWNNRRQ